MAIFIDEHCKHENVDSVEGLKQTDALSSNWKFFRTSSFQISFPHLDSRKGKERLGTSDKKAKTKESTETYHISNVMLLLDMAKDTNSQFLCLFNLVN